MPLTSTFVLSSKEGKEAYVQPVVGKDGYQFTVKVGTPPTAAREGTKAARGANFTCILSKTPIHGDYIKAEAMAGRMGQKLMAIVAEGTCGRVYIKPLEAYEAIAKSAEPGETAAAIHVPIANDPRALWCLLYGLTHFDHLFTPRQLVALTTFSDLVGEAREQIRQDAIAAKLHDNEMSLDAGGSGAKAYADAVSVYLGFCIDKNTLTNTTLATWQTAPDRLTQAFSRQALPMTWDFAEANPLSEAGGGFAITQEAVIKVLERLPMKSPVASVIQQDARTVPVAARFVSTDPPYYDNIGYADLSDYFYVWLIPTSYLRRGGALAGLGEHVVFEHGFRLGNRHQGREKAVAAHLAVSPMDRSGDREPRSTNAHNQPGPHRATGRA